ncbi:filamentous hemagglutinin N-terminal domain-containing protein [Tolypothrix bouteillei VB521301_2]|uniref:Filamentous hemagglutinin N-terminal domain-containing protein n=1 Tax=Tolypothrix bouteillei VB521301 TaxID=1479485 RepID=A0A8S9TBD0_9CYAN|nr:filamentous hemagglutinin N-terminal domain-containing protein [Tolypothrix bouteillei]KAF3889715.1 filamentous hemagglutinin N-terminal domain-containing protein [Tolypothrix bouteillei VB521301]
MKPSKRSLFFFSFPLYSIASLAPITPAKAQQVIPDNTLGSENSIVNTNVDVKGSLGDRIDGGATRGTSLFHSFEKFDVDANGRVYFNPQTGIQNIFSRVTGGNASNIQGTLGVLSGANLFFINPNGILFGPNAKLDVGGSFLGSTASSLLFGNQFEFSATSKLAPPQLLTVNIPTGLRFRDNPVNPTNPANITVQSYSEDINGNYTGLEVPNGKSIALVGGDVLVDYGTLAARSGRIELGGVRGTGEIGLDGNTLQLNFPDDVARADVRLKNEGYVIVRGSGGGSIAINAKDIEISDNSLVRGGISLSPTVVTGAQAGDITLNATGAIEISGFSWIDNNVVNNFNYSGNTISGNGGNINIKAGSFSMSGGAQLSASTYVKGNAGSINIRAENGSVSLIGDTYIFNNIEDGGDGKAGGINITAKSLSLNDGAQLQTLIRQGGTGEAGDVNVTVRGGDVTLAGVSSGVNKLPSLITSYIDTGAMGKGGDVNLTIENGSLIMNNGSQLDVSTYGKGNAGDVNVRAENGVSLTGRNTRIFGTLESGGEGKGGNINITVDKGSFNISDGAQINANTYGKGDAGNVTVRAENGSVSLDTDAVIGSNIEAGGDGKGGIIDITAKSLSLSSGGQLLTIVRQSQNQRPAGKGNAGNVNVTVRGGDVTLSGISSIDQLPSSIFSTVGSEAQGNSGNINLTIENGSLNMSNGAQISASMFGKGNGGNINLTIENGLLNVSDGAQISASMFGKGIAGDINVRAENGVSLTGRNTRIFGTLQSGGDGKGGNVSITVDKGSFNMSDGAQINANTYSKGDAGNVTVRAENGSVSLDTDAVIGSNIEAGGDGKGGIIDITAKSLSLSSGGQLLTIVRQADTENKIPAGIGNAGNVNVTVRGGDVTLDGVSSGANKLPSLIASYVDSGAQGNGGNINLTIENGSLNMSNGARIIASMFGKGIAGDINVRAENGFSLTGRNTRIFSTLESGDEGKGGNINITVGKGSFNMSDGAQINANTYGKGDAGNVTVRAENGSVSLDTDAVIGSNIEAGGDGKGGIIDITAKSLSLSSGGQLLTIVRQADTEKNIPAGIGNAGNVNVTVRGGDVTLDGVSSGANKLPSSIFSTVGSEAQGNGGDINLTIENGSLLMSNGAQISASTFGTGDAGNIKIAVRNAVNLFGFTTLGTASGSFNQISSFVGQNATGKGGNIDIKAGSLSMNDLSELSTATSGRGNAGKVSLQIDGPVTLTKLSNIRSNVEQGGEGIAGNINVQARSLTLTDGGQIGSIVFREGNGLNGGKGKAGNIEINAKDFVNISGSSSIQFPVSFPTVGFSSALLASAERGTTNIEAQAAGSITVTTNNFRLADGGIVEALTANNGNGGNITINAKTFEVSNGGRVTTSTSRGGKAGNIILRVSDRILLSGSNSGLFSNTEANSQGDGGSIDIDPKEFILRDGARISVNSEGSGNGGSIKIGAGTLRLDNAKITAETQSAQGGSIELNLQDLLILRRGSKISATAGRSQGSGDGGNITINIPDGVIIAFPQENSDITANAFNGRGGNISIRGALLGIAPLTRKQLEQFDPNGLDPNNVPTSDITAISQQQPQQEGTVQLNTEIDPNRGLVELPEEVTDPSKEIAQNPCQRGIGSRFIVTGRGGLPPSPGQTANSNNVQVDLLEPVSTAGNSASISHTTVSSTNPNPKQFVPAQGWVFNQKGEIVLTAYDPANTNAQRPLQTLRPTSCAAR